MMANRWDNYEREAEKQSRAMKKYWSDPIKRISYAEQIRKYPKDFLKERNTFIWMHDRVNAGFVPDIFWSRTREGFLAFLAYIGPIPKNMKKPSIGRKNHNKGYRPGNCAWQEHSENSGEPWRRYGSAKLRNSDGTFRRAS
jgi:hypothetical protein